MPSGLDHDAAPLIDDLKRDEGLRLRAYPDPLTGGAPWTIGYGHTGADVRVGTVWTRDQAEEALRADMAIAIAGLDKALPWWRRMVPVRQDVLINMAFNLGLSRLLGFANTLQKMKAGDYQGAADGMAHSLWARQVGGRAARLVTMMRTGERSDRHPSVI